VAGIRVEENAEATEAETKPADDVNAESAEGETKPDGELGVADPAQEKPA
jgi:hypothetical protein